MGIDNGDGLFVEGDQNAPILVICEPPDEHAFAAGRAMTGPERKFFEYVADSYGFSPEQFCYLPCAFPMPESAVGDKDQADHLARDRDEFLSLLVQCRPEMILVLGKHALRQLSGRAAQIGKARGQLYAVPGVRQPVLPMFGVRHCLWYPDAINIFVSDFNMLATLDDNDYNPACLERATDENTDYQWTLDLSEFFETKPAYMAVDTETTGLKWTDPKVRVLTVQLTTAPGMARCVPVDMRAARIIFPDMPERELARAVTRAKLQITTLLTDPSIRKIGHNLKFDHHQIRESLGVKVRGWFADTQQLAFVADDNMFEKSLNEVTRRWVPEMAGYADAFDATSNKADMLGELRKDPARFLRYAGGDTDANYRAARALVKLAQEDEQNWKSYLYIQLPALLAFADKVEPTGLNVDLTRLAELEEQVGRETEEIHNRVLSQIPAVIRRRHLKAGLRLSRADFKIDALFSPEGLNLTPIKFTKGTTRKTDAEKVPSTSAKEHLIYFANEPLVEGIMRWTKLDKMRGTYVGKEFDPDKGGPTGFWQHVVRKGDETRIHPSFFLHRTRTGRSASADPNAQNFPKRGDLAKSFRSIFVAPPGYKIIEADLSQAELRIAACQANERRMIQLYNEGVDIHANTGAIITGNRLEHVLANKKSEDLLLDRANEFHGAGAFLQRLNPGSRKTATVADFIAQIRYQAKAVNFGFLYGMQWFKFMIYAKTDYGIDYTEQEAMMMRERFFEAYPGLIDWHASTEREVYANGCVRALHGAIRRLPAIYSTQRSIQSEAVRQGINSPIQRFASDLGIMALWRLSRDCPDYIKPVAFIHDALVAYVREDKVQEGGSAIRWYMENNPLREWFGLNLQVPILADVSVGDRMSDVKEVKMDSVCPSWFRPEMDHEAIYATA